MGRDYSPLSFQKAIKPCHNETCVNLTVYDDDILELPETLYIFVDRSPGLSPNVMVKQEQFLVYINDTDGELFETFRFPLHSHVPPPSHTFLSFSPLSFLLHTSLPVSLPFL